MTEENAVVQALNNALISSNVKDTLTFMSLLRQSPLNVTQEILNQALLSACSRGNKFLVVNLLSCDVNVNCQDDMGNTPLLIVVRSGLYDIARLLLYKKANVNILNKNDESVLILSASSSNSTKMIDYLIKLKGVNNFFQKNIEGFTFLMKSVEALDFISVRLALRELKHTISRTTEQSICDQFVSEAEEFAQRINIHKIFLLVKNEAFLHRSAFLEAVSQSDIEIVMMLMNSGFYLVQLSSTIKETIHIFLNRGTGVNDADIEIVKKIIEECERKLNHVAFDHHIFLAEAVKIGCYELLDILCQHVKRLSPDAGVDIYYDEIRSSVPMTSVGPK